MRLGIIASGVGTATTFNLTYIPEFIAWNNATSLQSIKFNVSGDGALVDIDTNGILSFQATKMLGMPTNYKVLRLSNGFIPGKNCDVTVTNGVAANIDLFGFSVHKDGTLYFVYTQTTCVALTGREFSDFALLSFPSMSAVIGTDTLNIEYRDGLVQKFDQPELGINLGASQNYCNGINMIDNFDQRIKRVLFQPTAAQVAYQMKLQRVGNIGIM